MRDIRTFIAFIVFFLICVGVIMIYSSSGIYALHMLGDDLYFLRRHLMFLALGLVLTLSVMSFDYRSLGKYAKPILLCALVLLALVLIPGVGKESYGARRWFHFGVFNFQPSEFAKIAMIIYVADFLTRKKAKLKSFWQGFLPLMMVLGLLCGLIILQPDLGTTVSIAAIMLSMMFVAGARLTHLFMIALGALPLVIYLIISAPYRLARIMAFLDPWEDRQGIGFQLTQSQIALGSGGLFGVGLGKSQQKLFYLPAAHTDFILSIIGEEFGLIGTLLVVVLFISLLWQMARSIHRTADQFGYFLCVGIFTMIGLQAMVNIGVSMGALPTKGLPLPFISYGGSAFVFNMMAIGLFLNVSRTQDMQNR